jgi:hypothetical protein
MLTEVVAVSTNGINPLIPILAITECLKVERKLKRQKRNIRKHQLAQFFKACS